MQVDPLEQLVTALDAGTARPSLADLGGTSLLEDHDALLRREELPELVALVIDDTDALTSDTGRDFLLSAATAPRNPIVLEGVIKTFLSHPQAILELGQDLVDAWLYASRQSPDLLGGMALEASARLVLASQALSPYALLDRLTRLQRDLNRLNDDYVARAIRVAGAVAEHFAAPEVQLLLEALLDRDDVADDAAFELGMLTIRQALAASDPTEARNLLISARQWLADAVTEEERADASAFAATIDVLLAYIDGAAVTQEMSHRLASAVSEFRLNMLRMPPGWRTPRFDTLASWQHLVNRLERAQAATNPKAWLHAADLIDDLVSVYGAHRTLSLIPTSNRFLGSAGQGITDGQAPGLHALLAPQVERVFLAHESRRALLEGWLEEFQESREEDPDLAAVICEQARALQAALEARDSKPANPKGSGPATVSLAGLLLDEETTQALEDLLESRPEIATRIAARIEALEASRSVHEIPIIATVYRRIREQLRQQCRQGYVGRFAADVDMLILYLLSFLHLRLNETQKFRGEWSAYLRKLQPGEEKPLEKELGKDLASFLGGLGLRVELEVSNVGAGRVDVAWRPHDELITIELKRDWKNITWNGLSKRYLPQAISYQLSGPPLSFFMVLDLTDKPDGLAAFESCVHVQTIAGPASDPRPRTVVMFRIQGNKRDPHSL
ncbi:hypothetical protein AB0O28_02130 [Microbispora sp. NPDC088329]|uniref:hypothetical protein n=1 Tax=Microbispora sp. NPDC088329 TaxID=3154869 RepID=UPI0034374846